MAIRNISKSSVKRAIMHDPEVFDKPLEFIPERYIKDGKIDLSVLGAESAAFGYGRR
jgi:cytochrome P450